MADYWAEWMRVEEVFALLDMELLCTIAVAVAVGLCTQGAATCAVDSVSILVLVVVAVQILGMLVVVEVLGMLEVLQVVEVLEVVPLGVAAGLPGLPECWVLLGADPLGARTEEPTSPPSALSTPTLPAKTSCAPLCVGGASLEWMDAEPVCMLEVLAMLGAV